MKHIGEKIGLIAVMSGALWLPFTETAAAADTIAFASKNSVKNVAAKKTSSNTWKDVQKAFHVSDAQYNAAAKEIEAHKK